MTFSSDALAGKSILITGGSSGLGRAVAEAVARCGARVVIVGRDQGRLDATLDALVGSGHRLAVGELDNLEGAAALVSRAAIENGGLDGIFHAAGSELLLPARLTKTKHVEAVMGAAVLGGLGIAKAAGGSGVMNPGASVVMMSSAAARRGRPGMVVYSAAKASIEGLVRSLACELAPRSIRVNAIAAGGVRTAMHERLTRSLPETAVAAYEAAHPLGFGNPGDVANAALFLFSDASRWMTAATLDIDGGYIGS